MRRLIISSIALAVPALMLAGAPAATAVPIPTIEVTVAPASGPAGSVVTISGACGDAADATDQWLVSITGKVAGTSLGDPIVTGADPSGGAFKEKAQILSDTDPAVPTNGDVVDIAVSCESYKGTTAAGAATFNVTESAKCPDALPEATGPADGLNPADGFPAVFDGSNFVPGAPVIVCVYSSPVLVGAAAADDQGDVSIDLSTPDGLSGVHTYAVIGNDIETGDPIVLTRSVNFDPIEVNDDGMLPVSSDTPQSALPDTGSPSTLPAQATAAVVLLLAGGSLVLATRRRWLGAEPEA